jgi:simple sugar transport system ATP-binding protein
MVHQHFMLVGTLSVLENIILGNEETSFGGILDLPLSRRKLEEIIKTFRLNINLNSKVENLPVGIQQKIEILKVLYRESEILIFDEPTAVLTPLETDELFTLFKILKQEGETIILITHKLGEVLRISDRVTILRHGKVVGEKNTAQTNRVELAEMIVGGNLPREQEKSVQKGKKAILEVKNLIVKDNRYHDAVNDISFNIFSGEIFGIAGVEGNGQTELVEAINGLREIKSGEIRINGRKTISHIPADRHKHGMVNEYKLYENVLLGRQEEKRFCSKISIKEKHLVEYSKELINKYDVRPGDAMQVISGLSGGNQQKLVAARELTKESDLVIACNPTRGLDIKASAFVLNILLEERNKGKAVLLVSSDLNELLRTTDRIGVMYNGKLAAILSTAGTTESEIGMYMTGYIN